MDFNADPNIEQLVSDEGPNVSALIQEFKQAGSMPSGVYDVVYNEETRRMIWRGQSQDGRLWDKNMDEGQEALPWDGCADTRVPLVDDVINDEVALHCAAFNKAELRATGVNSDKMEMAAAVSSYLHWLARVKMRKALRLEVELSQQYRGEYGWCVAYVGWDREIGKRRETFTMEQLKGLASQAPAGSPESVLPQLILDPTQEEAAAEILRGLYAIYVRQQLQEKGFYEAELEDDKLIDLPLARARKAVKELREEGKTKVAMPYVCKNRPLIHVCKPYLEFLAARGTAELQKARALFWRRWMSEAELEAMKADGWDAAWIEEAKKTKGNMSSWAGALSQTTTTSGPSTKSVGGVTYMKISEENNPLIEVVYGFVKKVDEDGVTGIWQTIFSPHLNDSASGQRPTDGNGDFCAMHELMDYAHGQYPFVELKRENIGRSLVESRSIGEIAGTWQGEEKKQRDMLANRADLDTLPPVKVPKLGGVDYRLGPAAQVPLNKSQDIEAINLNAPAPTLALELLTVIESRKANYFGQMSEHVLPQKTAVKQEKAVGDFYCFWETVLLHAFALTVQYNPQEIVRVTGMDELAQLEPTEIMEELDIALEFDVKELNPDYLMQKLDVIHGKILPGDAGGVIDRTMLTGSEMRAVDPLMARRMIQDKAAASQKMFREVELQVAKMALGNEAEYVENDPTAPMKLQYLETIVRNNPKYLAKLGKVRFQEEQPDQRFGELLQNYEKNLQQSKVQEENKVVGRIGVKPIGAGAGN